MSHLNFTLIILLALSNSAFADNSYTNTEERKKKIERLQDALQISKAELELEKIAQEKATLINDDASSNNNDAVLVNSFLPPAPKLSEDGRLVEIFGNIAFIEFKGNRYELREGEAFEGYTVKEIGDSFVNFKKGKKIMTLRFFSALQNSNSEEQSAYFPEVLF